MLLPSEFADEVARAHGAAKNAADVFEAIRAAWSRRHPALADRDAHGYRLPFSIALELYKRDPKAYSRTVLAALAPPARPGDIARIEAIAARAFEVDDWGLIGWLAYLVDLSASRHEPDEARAPIDAIPLAHPERDEPVLARKFLGLLRPDLIGARRYVIAVVRYLSSIPESFVPPPNLILDARTARADDPERPWAILHAIWRTPSALFWDTPGALKALAESRSPFVQLLAARRPRIRDDTPKLNEAEVGPANPFEDSFAARPEQSSSTADEPVSESSTELELLLHPDDEAVTLRPRRKPVRSLARRAIEAWSQRRRSQRS